MRYLFYMFVICIMLIVQSVNAQENCYQMGSCHKTLKNKQILNPQTTDKTPPDTLPGNLAHQIYEKRYVEMMTEDDDEQAGNSSNLSGQ